ncbi:serine protease [Saccharicrinis sp. FJH2]|uniref:S1 family peptidase n=1 Tax=Saccharicrinis sp. FJH65 TaxID=3344659 RepID=UPI0035F42BBA
MKKILFISILCAYTMISFSQMITRMESLQSLYLEVCKDGKTIGSATGFIIKSKTQNYLVTNYHVVTNKNPSNKKWLNPNNMVSPNEIYIMHNGEKLGEYNPKVERLIKNNGKPLWFEFKIDDATADVVALPLKDTLNISIFPIIYKSRYDTLLKLIPTDVVYVLGFPKGVHSAPFMPIWKSGIISSEPDINQENKPIMWIDVNGVGGMSGAPVYFISNRYYDKSGASNIVSNQISVFLGIFSHGENDVFGALWKAQYLKDLFDKLP